MNPQKFSSPFLLGLLLLCGSTTDYAQTISWEQTNGPLDGQR
jgi:hypothetical protein